MEIIRGTDRLVIPLGGYVLKLPRSSVSHAIKTTIDAYERIGIDAVRRVWGLDDDAYQSPRWYLLHGMMANRREASLAKEFPDIVLRTRMFGGGALNVQPQVEAINLSSDEVAHTFAAHLGRKTAFLGHMIENPSNFGICGDGSVRFVDGGSSNLESVLRVYETHQRVGAALQEITRIS